MYAAAIVSIAENSSAREEWRERLARLLTSERPVEVALVSGDHHEVDAEREHERGEHEQVVGAESADWSHAARDDAVEEQAGDQRGPGERHEVVAEVVRGLSRAEPSHRNRQDAEHGRGPAPMRMMASEMPEEAAGHHEAARADLDVREVADDREREHSGHQREIPVIGSRGEDHERDRGSERCDLRADQNPARSPLRTRRGWTRGAHSRVIGQYPPTFWLDAKKRTKCSERTADQRTNSRRGAKRPLERPLRAFASTALEVAVPLLSHRSERICVDTP